MESSTPYEVLVKTMDRVRMVDQVVNGTTIKAELFPDIAIGDAPPDTQAAAAGGGA